MLVEVDEITLDGAKVQVRNQNIPIAGVQLDPRNPRIANAAELAGVAKGAEAQKRLQDLLWDDPDVHDLYRQVEKNGGLIERIIVRSSLLVAEGNCRTVVYRKLHEKKPNDPRWKAIPARVLPADISERQVAILLGEMHIAGKNQWSPFEKAGHIHRLSFEFGLAQDEIAQRLRTSKSAINHNIRAFEVMREKYLPRYGGTGAVRKFSYFLELFKKPELREWVATSSEAVDQFVEWVGTDKLARGEDVRELRDIVTNAKALTAFSRHGRDAARKILEQDRPELASPLFKLMTDMTAALNDARMDDIQRVRVGSSGARRIVRSLEESLKSFVDLCGGEE